MARSVLFSHPEIRRLLSDRFECAWENVRPAPRLRIRFGRGSELEGTLHGNVATWIVSPGGTPLDVLPGLFEPNSYAFHLRRVSAEWRRGTGRGASRAELEALRRLRLRTQGSMDSDLASHHAPRHDPSVWLAGLELESGIQRRNRESMDNTRVRLPAARRLILALDAPTPASSSGTLYRDVLGVDLESPTLGLEAYFESSADPETHHR